jgi:branched-chain amino acid transport system substrate-binding protein
MKEQTMKRSAMRTRLVAVAGVAALAGTVAACGSDSSSSGSSSSGGSKKQYVIATTQDLSGGTAALGKPVTSGLKTYFDYLNAQGGAGGHKIKVVTLDDSGKPDRGVTNAKQLLLQKPVGLLGNVSSAVSIPVQQQLDTAKVPQVMYTPVENLLKDPDYFAVGLSSTDNYYIAAQYIKSKAGAKKPSVSTLILNSPAQVEARKALKADVAGAGWTFGTDQQYEFGATDVSSQVQQIKAAHPDYVIGGFLDDIAPQIITTLNCAGVNAPVVNFSPGSGDTTFSSIHTSQFLAVREFVSPSDPAAKDAATMRAAAAKYGTKGDATSVNFTKGWIIGMLYADAIKKCGDTCTGAKIRDSLEGDSSFDVGDLGAPVEFSASSHAGSHSGRVYRWDATKKSAVAVSPDLKAETLGQ